MFTCAAPLIALSPVLFDHNAAGLLTRPLSAAQTMTALLPELPKTVYRYYPMFLVALVGFAFRGINALVKLIIVLRCEPLGRESVVFFKRDARWTVVKALP